MISFYRIYKRLRGFTLLELLIVVGVLAIVGTIVVLILNPSELFKQSRDARRMVDLKNIDSATRLARTESIFMGNTNTVYISVPDPALSGNATSTCPNMGLPPLDPNWKYNCVSQENLAKNNGTGWMPINFFSLGARSPFASLPVDPNNPTSSGQYYTFVTDGKKWELTSVFESDKNKGVDKIGGKDGGQNVNILEIGSKLDLTPNESKNRGI